MTKYHRMFATKEELKKSLERDIKDREKMRKAGLNTKYISQVISQKRRLLKSKRYWKLPYD